VLEEQSADVEDVIIPPLSVDPTHDSTIADNSGAGEDESTPAPEEPTLFDSTAQQRIPTMLMVADEEYPVTLVLNPVDSVVIAAYSKKCAEASATADDEDDLAARLRASISATVALFDTVAVALEDVGEEGEEPPSDWREYFSPQEKNSIVEEAIFNHRYVEPVRAKKGKRPRWGADLRNSTTRVFFPWGGRMVETHHTLRKADAEVYSEYMTLMSRTMSVRGVDAHISTLADWYDTHWVGHTGYKGDVPKHHKAAVFVLHMTRQKAAVRKN
jgi:hypothetical protein